MIFWGSIAVLSVAVALTLVALKRNGTKREKGKTPKDIYPLW